MGFLRHFCQQNFPQVFLKTLILAWFIDSHCWAQSANFLNLAQDNVKRVGVLQAESGQAVGTCFYCDERGYVATCFSNLLECKDAYVQFDTKTRLRVGGFVAASRGLDIAILQLLDIPEADSRFNKAMELRSDFSPDPGNQVLPWSPAEPRNLQFLPEVRQVLRGDEFVFGLKSPGLQPLACRADTCWLWLSQPSHASSNGAPVFNEPGHVVAMVSMGPNRQREFISAIHIEHVVKLIPKEDPKSKPIRQLKSWADPVPSINDRQREPADVLRSIRSSLGDDLHYGESLAPRFARLLDRIEKATTEKSQLEQSMATRQEQQLERLAKIETLRSQINSIVPEEAFTTRERDRDRDSKNDRDRIVTRYRHSAAQKLRIGNLDSELTMLQKSIIVDTATFDYETKIRLPFVNESIQRLDDASFFLADPLGLRPQAEHLEFEKSLTALIEEGGAPSSHYLARGMTRIHLKQYQDAMTDLKEAYDADTKSRPLCRALNARIVKLKGSKEKSDNLVKGLLRDTKDNPKLLTIVARIEMDGQSTGSAARSLQQAYERLPQETELQLGLAWLLSQSNANTKLAMETAVNATTRTAYRDWNSLAALANVYMMYRKKDQALETLQLATEVAPPAARPMCEAWLKEINGDNTIKRDWQTP